MKLVILDGYSVFQEDLPLLEIPGVEITYYERTGAEEIVERIGDAEGILTSKCKITGDVMDQCPNLKFIGELATGYDNLDVEAAAERDIVVSNCPGYATEIVAQHTLALILEAVSKVGAFNNRVQSGEWENSVDFCLTSETISALAGKTLGIFGYGNIGRKVGEVAEALGMTVKAHSRDGQEALEADIVSLHCPATKDNEGMVNQEFISKMKDGAILINTARGKLIDEEALAQALKSGKLAAAGLDVLRDEPPKNGSPLIGLPNCYITPHVAWMAKEVREKIVDLSVENVMGYINGKPTHRILPR